jgi:hypothetical protein
LWRAAAAASFSAFGNPLLSLSNRLTEEALITIQSKNLFVQPADRQSLSLLACSSSLPAALEVLLLHSITIVDPIVVNAERERERERERADLLLPLLVSF